MPRQKVVNLNDFRKHATKRQLVIRNKLIELASEPPVACVGIMIDRKGKIHTSATCIEPLQIPQFLKAINEISNDLETHLIKTIEKK